MRAHNIEPQAIVLTEHGRVHRWSVPSQDLIPDRIDTGASITKICAGINVHDYLFATTADSHLMEWRISSENIRTQVQMVNALPGIELTEPPNQMTKYFQSLAFATGRTLTRVTHRKHEQIHDRGLSHTQTVFEADIDLFGCDQRGHGFARAGNKLYWFCSNLLCPHVDYMHRPPDNPHTVAFDGVGHIHKIICVHMWALFLMDDGVVYAHQNGHHNDYKLRLEISFGIKEQVTDIVVRGLSIFYTTASGACYYTERPQTNTQCARPDSLVPEPLRFMFGYFIERVFVLYDAIVFQYDGNKLCLVHQYEPARCLGTVMYIDRRYFDGSMLPTRLDFFDGMSIILVDQIGPFIYFTTDTGQVYYCEYSQDMNNKQFERMRFFDDNPVAINRGAYCSTRSAGSLIARDV